MSQQSQEPEYPSPSFIVSTPEVSEAEVDDRVKNLLDIAQNSVAFIVALSAILGAAGFLIVNIYLAQFGEIQGFSIVVGRFVSASILFSLIFSVLFGYAFIVWRILKSTQLGIRVSFALSCMFLLSLINLLINNTESIPSWLQFIILMIYIHGPIGVYITFEYGFNHWGTNLFGKIWLLIGKIYFRLVIFLFMGIIGMVLFATITYPNIPQYMGGGKPLPVQLIFTESEVIDELPISLVTGTRKTQPILILSELNDGLLIHDEQLDSTLIIKNEFIGAIVDVKITQPTSVSGTHPMSNISSTSP